MQTVTGVGSSLWVKKGAGLFAPTRRKFPINGLAFYAPLWHPELNTSPFISKDLNAHSCTATGATWGIQGRTFDGVDDKIIIADDAALNPAAFTLEAWVKPTNTAIADQEDIIQKGATFSNQGYGLFINSSYGVRFTCGRTGGEETLNSSATSAASNWIHCAGTFDGTTMTVYINGAASGTATPASYESSAEDLNIGYNARFANFAFEGIIGEIMIYNRALTTSEIVNTYLTTKWRYQ